MTLKEINVELEDVLAECSKPDWDCYGAEPVTVDAIDSARTFLMAFPSDIPLPDFGAEPDGVVTFDWYRDRRYVISFSVGRKNRHSYAWMYGNESGHGVINLCKEGDMIDKDILNKIKKIRQLK